MGKLSLRLGFQEGYGLSQTKQIRKGPLSCTLERMETVSVTDKEIKKCLVCSMGTAHRFRDCFSPDCECNCLNEIRNEQPLPFEEWPEWFRLIPRKATKRFDRAHTKKGF